MINPQPEWASSYESTWDKVFADAQKSDFDPKAAIEKAWGGWVDSNGKSIQCVPPVPPGLPVTGKSTAGSFSPVDFKGSDKPEKAAKILSDAWKSWATAIKWPKPAPAPPFSSIISVSTDAASAATAHTKLISDLTAEFKKVPKDSSGAKAKYKAIATIFFNATKSLKVNYDGMSTSSPPSPLQIVVPVL